MALSVDMLRLTGDSRIADELELSTFNAVLGAQEPNGRWWTYNTPMNGERKAATQDIDFQERPGSPELSCCSVNGPRGLGLLSAWAVMQAPDGIVLNYFGNSKFDVLTPKRGKLRLAQTATYPVGSRVSVSVDPERAETFALHIRIPSWSRRTRVAVDGESVGPVEPGRYLVIRKRWKKGDRVVLELDMAPRIWVGEKACSGTVSVYRGPLLLAYDPRYDGFDPGALPVLDLRVAPKIVRGWTRPPKPLVLLRFATADGKTLTLCDFATAGITGTRYVSWLPAQGFAPASFSKSNPMRSVWPPTGGRGTQKEEPAQDTPKARR